MVKYSKSIDFKCLFVISFLSLYSVAGNSIGKGADFFYDLLQKDPSKVCY